MIDFIFSWSFLALVTILLLMYGNLFRKSKLGFKYPKFPTTSSLNPINVIDGKQWTGSSTLSAKYKMKNEKDFYIGNFRFSPNMILNSKMPFWWKRYQEKKEIYLTRENMITSTMLYGGMKSGKSIFFLNLLDNIAGYDNALVHDGTKLEFIAKTYNPLRDVIYNFYDDRATVHNILNEPTAIIAHFFQLMLKATSGKNEGGFFTTGALEHIQNIALLTNAQNFNSTTQKWAFFIEKLETLVENALSDGQKSEKDVIATLKQIMTPFLLINFRIQNGAETFTIDNFLDKNHAAKLFVSYPRKFQAHMQGLSAAFISMYTMVHLSRPDTDNKVYLYAIDELSSYLRVIGDDTDTLKDQTELLRSKAGAFIGGLQGEEENEKSNEILDKTVTQKIFFRTDGRKTKDKLIKSIGKVTYVSDRDNVDTKNLKNRVTSYNSESKDMNVIKEDDFLELGKKFEYIASVGDDLFRGYISIPEDEAVRLQKVKVIKKRKLSKEKEDEEINRTYKNQPFVEYVKLKQFEDYLAERYETYQIKREKNNISNRIAQKAINS